jgi:hypothetical protein
MLRGALNPCERTECVTECISVFDEFDESRTRMQAGDSIRRWAEYGNDHEWPGAPHFWNAEGTAITRRPRRRMRFPQIAEIPAAFPRARSCFLNPPLL